MTQYDRNEDIYEPNRAPPPPERGSNAVIWTLGLLGVALIAGLVLLTPRDTQTTSTPPSTTTAPSTTGSAPAPAPRPTTPTPTTPR